MSTRPEFIKKVMLDQNYRFFQILNPRYEVVYASFDDITAEKAVERFEEFLQNVTTGQFIVLIYNKNERSTRGEPRSEPYSFEISVVQSVREPQPMAGIPATAQNPPGFPTSSDLLDRFLNSKDQAAQMNVDIAKLQLEMSMRDKVDEIRKEYEAKLAQLNQSSGINGVINSLLPELAPHLLGMVNSALVKTPINGIGEQTDKDKIVAAINILHRIDPNFVANITKLAELAQNRPEIYKMAISALDKF